MRYIGRCSDFKFLGVVFLTQRCIQTPPSAVQSDVLCYRSLFQRPCNSQHLGTFVRYHLPVISADAVTPPSSSSCWLPLAHHVYYAPLPYPGVQEACMSAFHPHLVVEPFVVPVQLTQLDRTKCRTVCCHHQFCPSCILVIPGTWEDHLRIVSYFPDMPGPQVVVLAEPTEGKVLDH
jgi:hypothetical protein